MFYQDSNWDTSGKRHTVVSGRVQCPRRGDVTVDLCFICPLMDSIELDGDEPSVVCHPSPSDVSLATRQPERSETEELYKRFEVLLLAQSLGNVSQACREAGITRKQYYKYKRQYEAEGFAGLQDRARKVTSSVASQILQISRAHPSWGCYRIKNVLQKQGIVLSPPSIQQVLIESGRGTRSDRMSS